MYCKYSLVLFVPFTTIHLYLMRITIDCCYILLILFIFYMNRIFLTAQGKIEWLWNFLTILCHSSEWDRDGPKSVSLMLAKQFYISGNRLCKLHPGKFYNFWLSSQNCSLSWNGWKLIVTVQWDQIKAMKSFVSVKIGATTLGITTLSMTMITKQDAECR